MVPIDARPRIATHFVTPFALALALLGAVSLAGGAAADPAGGTPGHAERPGTADLRVARDPETGGWTLAPFATDAASLDRAPSPEAQMALNQSAVGLFQEALPAGGWTMNLQGRFQTWSIAREDAAGHLHFDCGEDPLSLFGWLTSTPEPVDAWGRPVR
jgi:hypothetical protein